MGQESVFANTKTPNAVVAEVGRLGEVLQAVDARAGGGRVALFLTIRLQDNPGPRKAGHAGSIPTPASKINRLTSRSSLSAGAKPPPVVLCLPDIMA